MALTNEAISAVTADQWRSACLHCMTLVDEFLKTDCLQEETVKQLLIEVNGDHAIMNMKMTRMMTTLLRFS